MIPGSNMLIEATSRQPRACPRAATMRLVAIACVLSLCAGCDAWKRGDSEAGLILVPGASRVTENGRELIRIRGRQSVMLVDPRGGRVVDFHRAAPPRVFFVDDPDRAVPGEGRERVKPVPVETAVWPNALGERGWRVELTPDVPELRDKLMWQSDASIGRVVLVSEDVGGLRLKCEYQLEGEGDAIVTVTLINTTGQERRADVRSVASVSAIDPISQPAATQPRNAGLTRAVEKSVTPQPSVSQASETIAWPAAVVPAHGTFAWAERWSIPRSAAPAASPATAPSSGH